MARCVGNRWFYHPGGRAALITMCHAGLSGGHLGVKKTSNHVQRFAYWPNWHNTVKLQLMKCETCAKYLQGKPPHKGLLQKLAVGEPNEVNSLDYCGPFPTSNHQYLLTVIDNFSRWAEAYPSRRQDAPSTARIWLDQCIRRFGCLLQILTDQGANFELQLFQGLCSMLKIAKLRTVCYKASSNGQVERWHYTLNSLIAKAVKGDQKNWDLCILSVLCAYRSAIHNSTGFTPNKLYLNREINLPVDIVLGRSRVSEEPETYVDYVIQQENQMLRSFELARKCMKKQAETRMARYNMRVKAQEFKVNDLVYYHYLRHKRGQNRKWHSPYIGPFRVIERLGPILYRIQKTNRSQRKIVYVDALKHCHNGGNEQKALEEAVELENGDLTGLYDSDEEKLPARPKWAIRPPQRFGFDE